MKTFCNRWMGISAGAERIPGSWRLFAEQVARPRSNGHDTADVVETDGRTRTVRVAKRATGTFRERPARLFQIPGDRPSGDLFGGENWGPAGIRRRAAPRRAGVTTGDRRVAAPWRKERNPGVHRKSRGRPKHPNVADASDRGRTLCARRLDHAGYGRYQAGAV